MEINNLPSFCTKFNLRNFNKSILKAENLLKDLEDKNQLLDHYKIKNLNLEADAIKYCSNLFSFLNLRKGMSVDQIFDIESNLFINSIKSWPLSEIEIHVRNPHAESIPPHQDQFYHYCNPREKAKIIFSLTELSYKNGFLEYYRNHLPLVSLNEHISSSVPAFSSFIPSESISNRQEKWQKVFLPKHKLVFHYMDSIHRAQVNETNQKCAFLVFRFDKNNVEDYEIKKKYKSVYDCHLKNLRTLN